MDPPEFSTMPVVLYTELGNTVQVREVEGSNFIYPLTPRAVAIVADDGNYAFYRPVQGLIYPLIQ